ncbi:MAG TPA: ABC transporter ATP-binding protein [Bacteroidales bacterium]|jgi:iron complex transport system ATP-binding protein|nr:ABC transporter ATP-binding protein [Bacteroidales bacterium]MDI9573042.1 ABC transporter ATP-binding protein [Bacteroidota bacterium]MBP9511614.1 ABC transporter ATP-binding protein [Bacteroidales bacterium]MBP9588090.1 ABC transporter ATP-binding protein [Bacteroidales bacterium]HOE59654.1 ABC transporter ATP-binding protein [Bacteroidales bacterium]
MKFNRRVFPIHEDALTTNHLSIGYLNPKTVIASDINLNFRRGRLYCIIGPNGSGKTTLLRTLSGFLKPLAGQITISGKILSQFSPSSLSTCISIVLTKQPALPLLTVYEVVAMGRQPYTGFWGHLTPSDKAVVHDVLQMVGIHCKAAEFFDHLSDGEKQKVMIAKALAQQTPYIFLDEPAAFLDFPSRIEIMQLLANISHQQNKTILISTHDVPLAFRQADEIILMATDKPIVSGVPNEIFASSLLEDYFEHNGKKFNPFSFDYGVEQTQGLPVFIDVNEELHPLIAAFIKRRGFLPVAKAENSQHWLRIDANWEIRFSLYQQVYTFHNLEELDLFLKNAKK